MRHPESGRGRFFPPPWHFEVASACRTAPEEHHMHQALWACAEAQLFTRDSSNKLPVKQLHTYNIPCHSTLIFQVWNMWQPSPWDNIFCLRRVIVTITDLLETHKISLQLASMEVQPQANLGKQSSNSRFKIQLDTQEWVETGTSKLNQCPCDVCSCSSSL